MPLDEIAAEANPTLLELGFEPLDELNGRIGGERHGIWDWTWVAHRRFALHAYTSIYAWDSAAGWTAEVWAQVEADPARRSLVRHLDALALPLSTDDRQVLVRSVREAAGRALRLVEQQPAAYQEAEIPREFSTLRLEAAAFGLEPRLPYATTVELVHDILMDDPHEVWTNQELLRELLRRGHATDRADVNSALSDLAAAHRATRVARGRYSASAR